MDAKKRNDIAELTRLGLSTFLYIDQVLRYEYQYIVGKKSKTDGTVSVNDSELIQSRDNLIKYACLAGVGIIGLFAIGFANRNSGDNR